MDGVIIQICPKSNPFNLVIGLFGVIMVMIERL